MCMKARKKTCRSWFFPFCCLETGLWHRTFTHWELHQPYKVSSGGEYIVFLFVLSMEEVSKKVKENYFLFRICKTSKLKKFNIGINSLRISYLYTTLFVGHIQPWLLSLPPPRSISHLPYKLYCCLFNLPVPVPLEKTDFLCANSHQLSTALLLGTAVSPYAILECWLDLM